MDGLLPQLAIATAIVCTTIVIHLLGLDGLQMLVRLHLRRFARWVDINRTIVPLGIVLGLFLLHGIEIWLYALVYRFAGVLGTLEQALYFSTSAYSTAGETGALLPVSWRIIGVLESVNGMLLIGWSTAFLFQSLNHLMWEEEDGHHSLPKGAIARGRRKRA